jgi:hypothetical protein
VKCNEVGFTEQNVQAICDINASTKTERKKVDDGCIGEKGIGDFLSTSKTNLRKVSNRFFQSPIGSLFTQMGLIFASTDVAPLE